MLFFGLLASCLCLFLFCFEYSTLAKSSKGSGGRSAKKVTLCDSAALERADLCGEKLFFVGKNARPFPTSESETGKYCRQTTSLVSCVKSFTDKCARNELQKNLANVMLYTVRNHHKGVCGSKSKKTQLVTMSKCANAIRKKSTSCMNRMLVEYGQAMALKEKQYRIPYACCSFHKMRFCILNAAEKAGSEMCSRKATEIFDQYIGSMAGNTLELMCTDFDADSDRCLTVKKKPFDQEDTKTPQSLLHAFGDLLKATPEN